MFFAINYVVQYISTRKHVLNQNYNLYVNRKSTYIIYFIIIDGNVENNIFNFQKEHK